MGRGWSRAGDSDTLKHFGPQRPWKLEIRALSGDKLAALTMAPSEASAEPCKAHDFAEVYQAWFRPVYRWVRVLGGPGIDAEDLAQEVFIVVQRKLGRFDGKNLAGWLYRITQLTVSDHRRRAWFRNVFLRSRDVVLDELVSPASSQEERLDRKERERYLYQLINQLNPKWRNSYLLFEVGGLTGEEIANLQGIPPATVRTHLSRARKELTSLVAARHARGER
jgi:RNA polymerase sigma-70 factor (ECF subfamily)